MKKKNLLLLILPFVAIILETNPNGVTATHDAALRIVHKIYIDSESVIE